MPRRFEFKDGKAQKFWQISQKGKGYTVRYGRIGTKGQTKTFSSSIESKKAADSLVTQKVRKGYSEISSSSASQENIETELAVSTKTRRFELRGSKTPKWWNIRLDGKQCETFYAKLGVGPPIYSGRRRLAGAQVQSRSFATVEKAICAVDKQCRDKIAAGYVETGINRLPARGELNSAWRRIEEWFRDSHHLRVRSH